MPPPTATTERHRRDLAVAMCGLLVLVVTTSFAMADEPSSAEVEAFRFVNRWPDWIESPFWIVMQAGSAAMIVISAVVVVALRRDLRLAGSLLVAGGAAWVLAKLVKEVVERGRPAAFVDDVIERPEWEGLGFVSGHAAVAFALATVVSAVLPGRWKLLPWAIAAAVAVLRVYTGAHLPLDVIGGAGLGMAVGASVVVAVGRPGRESERAGGAVDAAGAAGTGGV